MLPSLLVEHDLKCTTWVSHVNNQSLTKQVPAGSPVRPEDVLVMGNQSAGDGAASTRGQTEGNVVHPNQGAPKYPTTGTTIHTLCTSNGSPYLNFQTRIMCARLSPHQGSDNTVLVLLMQLRKL